MAYFENLKKKLGNALLNYNYIDTVMNGKDMSVHGLGFGDSSSSDEMEYKSEHRPNRKPTKEEQMLGIFSGDNANGQEARNRYALKPAEFVPAAKFEHDTDVASSSYSNASKSVSGAAAPHRDFGKFANSAVWNMMAKMGYKAGEGLGKHGEGQIEPIQVSLRRAGEGISFSGSESQMEANNKALPNRTIRDQKNKKPKRSNTPSTQLRELQAQRSKTEYKLLEDLRQQTSDKAKEVFVDMTTNTEVESLAELAQRILPTVESQGLINDIHRGQDLSFDRLEDLKRERELAQTHLQSLKKESALLTESIERRQARIGDMERIKSAINDIDEIVSNAHIGLLDTMENDTLELFNGFKRLQELACEIKDASPDGVNHWDDMGLERVITGAMDKYLPQVFHIWNPSMHPRLLKTILGPMRQYVWVNEAGVPAKQMTPFESLLNRTLVPKLKRFVSIEWDPQEDYLQDILEQLPPVIVSILSDTLGAVLRRLVESINPRPALVQYLSRMKMKTSEGDDQLPAMLRIDFAILPWLPYLQDSKELISSVRSKLCAVIEIWKPTVDNNRDVMALIAPWVDVLQGKDKRKLCAKISSRLEDMLQKEFTIDAQHQILWPFKALEQWYGILPFATWFVVVQKQVMPKFLDYLKAWLEIKDANYSEIADWYEQWKETYPLEIMEHSEVQDEFKKALIYMSYALLYRN